MDNSAGPDKDPASNDDRRQTAGMHKKRPRAELTKNRDVFTILDVYPVKKEIIMLRIEILFDRETTKNMKAGTLQALRGEIERRLCAAHPEIWLRIDKSSQTSLMVSGTRNDREKENVMETLEAIWQDDNWLPAA